MTGPADIAAGPPPSGSAPDWDLGGVLSWIDREGRLLRDLGAFVGGLAERLERAGAPIWRFYIGIQTIHPQLRAMAVVWRRGVGVEELSRRHGVEWSSAYIGSPVQEVAERHVVVRHRLDAIGPGHHTLLHEVRDAGGTDYVALPVAVARGRWPVLSVATDRPGGFSDADLAKFAALVERMGAAIEMHIGYQIASTLIDTYVGRHAGERIFQGLIRRGDGEQINAVLWFSDLRGFTRLSEALPPDRVLLALNVYFGIVGEAIRRHGGEILKFIGDGVMAIFPIPDAMFIPDACAAAADAARESLARMGEVDLARESEGEPALRFGVGLHIGMVTYGNIGTEDRLDFTVVGAAVNRGARLESLTKALHVPVLASAEFAAMCPRPLRSMGAHRLRGLPRPVEVFTLA